ncbi:hypothetical protein CcNV_063 [Crangon crangon nudivirus]|uniref:Uncharacterized protein n=1 Tax=Crangon crangon nudivirus TaxID=2880838 RepID=A0AAE8Y124_9VIRU|nr:hypothetical protein QKT25_gp064 [Crangon crangon nudivirus]UBZ25548.1 hypothetical protein CcNV_063 [Crangon crangon nudivirus]
MISVNNISRLNDQTNLLRSHYYLFKNKYEVSAVGLQVNDSVAYLHKEYRGYGYHHFTHTDLVCMIKVLGFHYFGFRIDNLNESLVLARDMSSCACNYIPSTEPEVGIYYLYPDNKVDYTMRWVCDAPHRSVKADILQMRHLHPYGIPHVVSQDTSRFDYKTLEFNRLDFFEYINTVLKANVSAILQNPISCVYSKLAQVLEIYKYTYNRQLFYSDILPSIYEYMTAINILYYIENINNIDDVYTRPIR